MIKFIKSMTWFIKKNWYRYILVLFFGLVVAVLGALPTKIIANLTDSIELNEVTYNFLIYEILIPFLVIIFLIYIFSFIKRTCMNFLTTSLYYALETRYMDRILIQDATFFERLAAGDLLTRALGDINQVKFSGGNRLLNIFVESITVIVYFVFMLLIEWLLAILCFIPMLFIVVTNLILKHKVTENWKEVREKSSDMGNALLESITNVRTIRAYSKEEENLEKNLKHSQIVYETEKKNLKVTIAFQPIFQFIVMISLLICYGIGSYFYYTGRIAKVSDIVQFAMYLGLFQAPLIKVGNMINNFYQSLVSADRLNEVYDSKSNITEGDLVLDEIETIEFKDFSFKYDGDSFYTLSNISLTIKSGQTVGIVGKTGSGKSTLVKMLLRQLPLESDNLFINERCIKEYSKDSIRRSISYIPQEATMFSRSVYDNVALGKILATDEEINNSIELSDFKNDVECLADGLDTIVGEYGVTLSGGQKQRLGIARAFVKNSDILIMDDSLSAVDGKTEANIIDSLASYRGGKTNIIISHRLSAVKDADIIFVLDSGNIIERGTHSELMMLKGWYYEQYISQQMKEVSE